MEWYYHYDNSIYITLIYITYVDLISASLLAPVYLYHCIFIPQLIANTSSVYFHILKNANILWFFAQVINFDSPRGGISLVTEKGPETTSRLMIQKAVPSDSGIYKCEPSNANPSSIKVHVVNGKLKFMYVGNIWYRNGNTHIILGTYIKSIHKNVYMHVPICVSIYVEIFLFLYVICYKTIIIYFSESLYFIIVCFSS